MEVLHAAIISTCPAAYSGVTGGLFLRAMATAITTHCLLLENNDWPKDSTEEVIKKGDTYDFIIVGAGTAGSLVASYLSNANPSWSVLLIEAGGNTEVESEIPAFLFLNQNSKSDWFYKTEPDKISCLGFRNQRCIWSKGKCMGGSSSVNAMLYIRGHPSDYDSWKSLGNAGWGYDDLKIYFERQEQMLNLTDPKFEGHSYDWYSVLNKAWGELGFQNHDYNGHEAQVGIRKVRILTSNGQRVNTARFFLRMAKNVTIMKNTYVKKVILNPTSNKVIGLAIQNSDITIDINVKKEVILSAGSIGTPLILMNSGIGPKTPLDEVGIECVHDLPVGKNLQDHLIFPLFLKTKLGTVSDPRIFNLLLLQYVLTKTGPISNIGITDYMGFINTNNTNDGPDVQFHHTYFPKKDNLIIRTYLEGVGYKDEVIRVIEDVNVKHDLLGIYPTLLQPQSTGEVLLNKSDSLPIIKSNYFKHDNDINTLLKSIRFIKKLENTEAFMHLEIEIVQIQIPGCEHMKFDSDEYWECYIKHMATTIYHPVGTAKMGPKGDKTSVVGSDLLVNGVKNLRVVDASVMPVIPKANTMAATLVIAQKAVDKIVKQYLPTLRDEL